MSGIEFILWCLFIITCLVFIPVTIWSIIDTNKLGKPEKKKKK